MSDTPSNLPAVRHDLTSTDDSPFSPEDEAALAQAYRALEHPSMTARVADMVGRRLGSLTRLLPMGVSTVVASAANRAIQSAMKVALRSLDETRVRQSGPLNAIMPRDTRRFHKAAAAVSGAAGGAFGFASLPVELPISTMIILRSIADIARSEGEDLSDPKVAIACLEVFALGAHEQIDQTDDHAVDHAVDHLGEGGYFAIRTLLARTVSDAAKFVAAKGVSADLAAPVLVRFMSTIGSRFGLVVSEKLAAQAMPIVGAAGGAAVNYAFINHFQSLASGHFTVRRLERRYGETVVRVAYERLRRSEKAAA